jgi:hypothetical protein
MLSSNMLLLNLILLIDATFSTPTGDYAQNPSMSAGRELHPLKSSAFHGALFRQQSFKDTESPRFH